MRIQKHILLSFAIALTITSAASAPGGSAPDMPAEVGVAIALQVAGHPFHFEGKAKCEYVPVASIDNVVAEKWTASLIEPNRSMGLTLWRPKNRSGDLFSLHVLMPACQGVHHRYGQTRREGFCRGFRKGDSHDVRRRGHVHNQRNREGRRRDHRDDQV